MKEFDFRTAWNTLAKPAFESILAVVKEEINLVAADTTIVQVDHAPHYDVAGTINGKMFTVGMPTKKLDVTVSSRLLCFMACYDTHVLASWASIVYCYGHWGSGKETQNIQQSGAYWKFAKALSQCVRDRLKRNMPAAFAEKSYRPYLGIQEGMLHLYYSTPKMWLNQEIGLATEANAALAYAVCLGMGEPSEKDVARLRRKMNNGPLKGWIDLSRFMVEEKTS